MNRMLATLRFRRLMDECSTRIGHGAQAGGLVSMDQPLAQILRQKPAAGSLTAQPLASLHDAVAELHLPGVIHRR